MARPKPTLQSFSITSVTCAPAGERRTRQLPLLSTTTISKSRLVCRISDRTHSRSLESAARLGITTVTRNSANLRFYDNSRTGLSLDRQTRLLPGPPSAIEGDRVLVPHLL